MALQGPEGGEAEYLNLLLCFTSPNPSPSSGMTGKITQRRKITCAFLTWMCGPGLLECWEGTRGSLLLKFYNAVPACSLWKCLPLWYGVCWTHGCPWIPQWGQRLPLLTLVSPASPDRLPHKLPFGSRFTRALLCCMFFFLKLF